MSSTEKQTAEQRFKEAFERLKFGAPHVLPRGTKVSQNNVAKEAGADPTALRKSRYPELIREIQAYVEVTGHEIAERRARQAKRRQHRDSLESKVRQLTAQRDDAHSQLIGAKRVVLELLQEKALLQARLDELRPEPPPIRK